jgi:hypothetical protein
LSDRGGDFRIFRNFRYRIGRFSQPLQEYLRTGIGARKGVSASFRRFPPLRDIIGRARVPKDSRFPPFPPVIWRPWTRRRQSVRVVPAAAADRAAPVEEAMLMNIMPILYR